jgi:hypothetical protein
MRTIRPWPIIVPALLGALAAGFWFSRFTAIGLDKVGPEEVGKVFLALIFVALVIERATEVYVNTSLEPEKQQHLQQVRATEVKVQTARGALNVERQSPAPSGAMISQREGALDLAIQELEAQKRAAEPKLIDHRSKTIRQTSIVATVLGVLIAVVGVRTLAPSLPDGGFPSAASDLQQGLFAAVDVLITGALLAGGADALHQLIKRFIQFAGQKEGSVG